MELQVNGTSLHGEIIGEGPLLLCPHGGPGTDSTGQRRLAYLAEELGMSLCFYDHRGHGRSEWVPVAQCTQDQLVDDMEAIRKALGQEQIYLLGISWGGMLSLMYAARYPDRVKKLCLVGASASFGFMGRAEENARERSTPEQWAAYKSLWDGSLADNESFRYAFEVIRPLYFHTKSLAAAANAARSETNYRIDVRNFVISQEYPKFDCRPELSRITAPTMLMVGRHDWICPPDQSEEIHRLIPHADLVLFEESGHSPHVEERELFNRTLKAFITGG
jgi:proline iminopeptidase